NVLIGVPFSQSLVRSNCVRLSPRVEIVKAEYNRNDQHEHQGQTHETGFKETSCGKSPTPASKLMNHRDSEAAERQSEPEQIVKQKRDKELRRIEERSHDASRARNESDEQCGSLNPI